MKLERLHESVLPVFVMIAGLALAIYAGMAAGSGKTGTVAMIVGGIIAAAFLLVVRERMWMLIPTTWMLTGKVSVLPLPFSIAQLAVMFALATFLLLKAFKIVRLKPKTGFVEIWMLLVLGYLLTVFLRNPVGVDALGSDRVGGRPYFDVAIAYCAYWVLSRSVASPKEALFLPLLAVGGHAFHATLNFIAFRFPFTIGPLSKVYSGILAAENPDAIAATAGESRDSYLAGTGSSGVSAACSYWPPLTLVNPIFWGRFITVCLFAYLILRSGYRSVLVGTMMAVVVATYFRHGGAAVLRVVIAMTIAIGCLILVQGNLIQLPLPAQRALSFLPGKWDYAAKSEAQGSTEWRIEMWEAMLTGDKYIANKWLGDGFGFTRRQLQIMTANSQTGSTADQQENLLISGGVHSGPITTIRYVGYVGLALFMVLTVLIAIRAAKLIRRSANTPFLPMALFFGLHSILHPLTFVVIFGAYETDLPNVIFVVGLQNLLINSLDAYAAKRKEGVGPVQAAPVFRRSPQFGRPAHIS